MSLQARIRGASDWYHPERDIGHNFHTWLQGALMRLEAEGGMSERQSVKLTEVAGKLARLVGGCVEGKLTHTQLEVALRGLDQDALKIIGKEMLTHQFLVFREARVELLPKRAMHEDEIRDAREGK